MHTGPFALSACCVLLRFVVLILPLALDGGVLRAGEDAAETRPNIVILMLDTVRPDHCSAYGYDRDTTPTLEQMAKEGVLFHNHFSTAGWTMPSIMSLFTGLSPVRHAMYDDKGMLPKGTATLASQLSAQGYATIGVTCNLYSSGKFGFGEGFDAYDDYTLLLDYEMNLFGEDRPPKRVHQTQTSGDLNRLALRHLSNVPPDQPYFLFILYFDPHTDYTPPASHARRYDPDYDGPQTGYINELPEAYVFDDARALEHVKALYDAEIRYTDEQAGVLLETLKAQGRLSDRDLVIYTSDHGEEFNEHGGIRHRRTIYGECLRVPFAMRWPARLPAGVEVNTPTIHEDVFATLARALAWPVRAKNYSPVDLAALARGEPTGARAGFGLRLRWEDRDWDGWRTPTHSLLRHRGTGLVEAYDLLADPGEQRPLPPDAPAVADLRRALDGWLAGEAARALSTARPDGAPALTPRQQELLRSMGYAK